MNFSIAQVSHQGGRESNEDRLGYCHTPEAGIFVLADGMGGHPEGEVAAEIAVQSLTAAFQRVVGRGFEDARSFLSEAVREAHHAILRHAASRGMRDTPRTTLVAALVDADGRLTWVHCGDSRLYLVRGHALLVRTRDHSYAERRPDELPQPRPNGHKPPNRHVLYTCLGSPVDPIFDLAGPVSLQQGDRILLCSDGLWDALEEPELVDGMQAQVVTGAVPQLVERALQRAGETSDNVSALAFEWTGDDGFEATRQNDAADGRTEVATEMFASTVQAQATDLAQSELDDADIDQAIAEINAAIRRAAERKK